MPALLEAAGQAGDRILEHSLTYALIEIGDPKGTEAGLSSNNAANGHAPRWSRSTRWMAAVSTRSSSRGCLASAEPGLKETAAWIVGRHPDWAAALAGVLGERLSLIDLPPADRAELERQLGRFAQAAPDPAAPGRSTARRLCPIGRAPEQPAGHGLVEPEGRGRAARVG